MLRVQNTPADTQLQPYIAGYVQRESFQDKAGLLEPVVARVGTMLEFLFADPYHIPVYGSLVTRPCPRITVIGPISVRRVQLLVQGHLEALVVLFRPLGLYRFFRTPVRYFAEIGTEGHSAFGSEMSLLYEQLGNATSLRQRKELLDSFFLRRLSEQRPLDRNVNALRLLISNSSVTKVEEVSNQAGISRRQLERFSLDCAGVTPKILTRVARFQRALQLRGRNRWSWLRVAHEIGYHDQMHMIRDFRQFAGCTPAVAEKEIAPEHLINFF